MFKTAAASFRTLGSWIAPFASSFGFGFLILFSAAPALADISVRASVTPQRAQVGQSVALSIEIQGAQSVEAPTIDVDGFDGRYIGPSTQVSFVNGQVSASTTHRYALVPLREGVFTLGPFKVQYSGKEYQTGTVQVAVSAAADRATGGVAGGKRGDSVRLQLVAREGDLYLSERIPIEVALYVRSTQVTDLQFPTLPAEGFSVEAFPQPDRSVEVFEGQRYDVFHFRSFALPLQAGTRSLGPASMQMSVLTQGGGFFAQKRALTVQSNSIDLNVLPLPQEGRPADFEGAVGQFGLDVSASPAEVIAGDPLTVKMILRGEGNLTDTHPPKLSSTEGFRAYDPQPSKDDNAGTRTFEQVLIPESERVTAVPPVRFSFFDSKERKYRTLNSEPIALTVRPRADNAAPQIVGAPSQQKQTASEALGRDIVYIKDDPGDLRPRDSRWYGGWLTLLWLPLPILAFAAAFFYDRRRERLTGDLRYARFSRAGKEARATLSAAEAALAAGNIEQCYDHLSRAVQQYLAAKLDLAVGSVGAESIAGRGLSEAELQPVRQFFSGFEQARYTGHADAATARTLLDAAKKIVDQLERKRGLKLISLAAIVALLGSTAVAASDTPQSMFFKANSLYAEGHYQEAIEQYQAVLDSDRASANLYFNLGNAYFKLERKGEAILNYERALQLAPGDPDIEANLSFARSLTGAGACTPRLWQRFAFPLSTRMNSSHLWLASICFYTLSLGLLSAFRLIPSRPRWLMYAATGAAFIGLLTASSLGFRLRREEWRDLAVVVRDGELPVRFEPTSGGTTHFSLKEGTRVAITDKREGWVQVQRCDGRRGWTEAAALAPLS